MEGEHIGQAGRAHMHINDHRPAGAGGLNLCRNHPGRVKIKVAKRSALLATPLK